MATDDVVLNKSASIQRCLRRIRTEYQRDTGLPFADDYNKQDIVVLNLIRACQSTLDLANYLIRKHKLGLPQSSKESFTLLWEADFITKELAEKLESMIGFRNIAVHEYQKLDLDIVAGIAENHLVDFERFTQQILGRRELYD